MYRPKHRAQIRRRPTPPVSVSALHPARPVVVAGLAALALATVLSQGAYADPGGGGGPGPHVAIGVAGVFGHAKPDKPDKPDKPKPDKGKPDKGKPDQGKPNQGKPDRGKQKDRGRDSAVGKPPKSQTEVHSKAPTGSGDQPGSSSAAGKPSKSKTQEPGQDTDPTATNGGHALSGDADATSLQKLVPTAAPATAYEMPFPCGEVWSGSTRAGHSPSIRAVDFNYAGGDQGKPVVAAASGTVVTAVVGKNKPSYGQYVVIDHGNGESSLYAHLDSVLVVVGQSIAAGTQLGTVGETGNADGSHLHFEERVGNAVVDAWFHGTLFPMNSSQASQNCGGALPQAVASTDIPMAGDIYGGKAAELMVYRRTAAPASYFVTRTGKAAKQVKIGSSTSQPVLGDWDGDGRVNPGVRDPATRVFTMKVRRNVTTVKFGKPSDLPVAGNWDGVGGWEVGVWRPKAAKFLLRNANGTKTKVQLGTPTSLPVTGDWDGDGITDLGVYDSATATFTLLGKDPATGLPTQTQVPFGVPGDLPVTGDWDGNGVTELGSWNPYSTVFAKRGVDLPAGAAPRVKRVVFGRLG